MKKSFTEDDFTPNLFLKYFSIGFGLSDSKLNYKFFVRTILNAWKTV